MDGWTPSPCRRHDSARRQAELYEVHGPAVRSARGSASSWDAATLLSVCYSQHVALFCVVTVVLHWFETVPQRRAADDDGHALQASAARAGPYIYTWHLSVMCSGCRTLDFAHFAALVAHTDKQTHTLTLTHAHVHAHTHTHSQRGASSRRGRGRYRICGCHGKAVGRLNLHSFQFTRIPRPPPPQPQVARRVA